MDWSADSLRVPASVPLEDACARRLRTPGTSSKTTCAATARQTQRTISTIANAEGNPIALNRRTDCMNTTPSVITPIPRTHLKTRRSIPHKFYSRILSRHRLKRWLEHVQCLPLV